MLLDQNVIWIPIRPSIVLKYQNRSTKGLWIYFCVSFLLEQFLVKLSRDYGRNKETMILREGAIYTILWCIQLGEKCFIFSKVSHYLAFVSRYSWIRGFRKSFIIFPFLKKWYLFLKKIERIINTLRWREDNYKGIGENHK